MPSAGETLIIAGPTSVGKSELAVEIAERLGGEIVAADAFQVYRGLEVLTAQPPPELRRRVSHHLVGFLPVTETMDAARFAALAHEAIAGIRSRGGRPILVGGSGLYLKAITHGLAPRPAVDPVLRARLLALPVAETLRQLLAINPEASARVDLSNPRRVLRALEIALLGSPAQGDQHWRRKDTPGFHGILLLRDRDELDARIAAAVRSRLAGGAIQEVARSPEAGVTAGKAIGFAQIRAFLRGDVAKDACIEGVVLATRRYAKRQLTWFRNQFSFKPINLTGLRDTHEIVSGAMDALGSA